MDLYLNTKLVIESVVEPDGIEARLNETITNEDNQTMQLAEQLVSSSRSVMTSSQLMRTHKTEEMECHSSKQSSNGNNRFESRYTAISQSIFQ